MNKRLDNILKNLSSIKYFAPHLIFVIETALGYAVIPEINGYRKVADPSIRMLNHDGVVGYVHNSLSTNVFDISYKKGFLLLRFDFNPKFGFIGTYIQPENSPYFNSGMFSDLCKIILTSKQRGLIPILGGDTNCRYGNLNCIFREQNICYEENVDAITYGTDMCISCNIFPVNHLEMCNKIYAGDCTYFKGYKNHKEISLILIVLVTNILKRLI